MELFENEIINITRIITVNKYRSVLSDGKPHHKQYPVKLPTYELIFFYQGDGIATYADVKIHDCPNSVRYLPKGKSDGEYIVEARTSSECIDIYFDTDSEMPDVAVGLENLPELKPLFGKIFNIWNQKKPGYYTDAMAVMYEIIKKIKSHSGQYLQSSKVKLLEPAVSYIHSSYTDADFSYTAACNTTDLSYSYFKELFIKAYKMSPVKYVAALRIERAKELLITEHYSITEISEMCGFRNVYYFSNVFKKQVGVSPKVFCDSINQM